MITALIPARSGSKRVPHKNIRRLNDVPLLVYSVKIGLACCNKTIVTTDSKEYGKIAEEAGATVIYRETASDEQGDYEVVKHALPSIDTELIAYLRPTTPIRTPTLVTKAITDFTRLLKERPEPHSLRSVEEMGESAFKCFTMFGPFLTGIGRSVEEAGEPNDNFVKTYKPNGYVDIVRKSFVESGRLWGENVYGFKTPPVIEIDTEQDFKILEYQQALEGGEHVIFT